MPFKETIGILSIIDSPKTDSSWQGSFLSCSVLNEEIQNIQIGDNGVVDDNCGIYEYGLKIAHSESMKSFVPPTSFFITSLEHSINPSSCDFPAQLALNPIPAHCTSYMLHRINKWKHSNLKELDLEVVKSKING